MAEPGDVIEAIIALIIILLFLPIFSQLLGVGNIQTSQIVGFVEILLYLIVGFVLAKIASDLLN